MHHPSQVVHPTNVHNTLLDGFAVIVNPFNDDIPNFVVVRLAAAGVRVVQGEGGPGHLEGAGGPEGRLGLGIKVDAQLLEVGRGRQFRVDAARGVFQER